MDNPPMILPKGIVFNIDRVYKEVASHPVVPPEKIYEYWHVYTTTFKKLKDPTASRLENFWWHVMGSDRRLLSGPTLAKLFEHISNGPTFVRLRGPPNRYEPPWTPTAAARPDAPTSQSQMAAQRAQGGIALPSQPEDLKPVPSSSSKPPPAHPILKKPRGPSSSGPRPTARFISPPPSVGGEESKDSEADSLTSGSTGAGVEMKAANSSHTKTKQKKPTGPSKKKPPTFVATSASKRRPAMPRRQSSQSSTGTSDVGSREGSSSLSSKYGSSQRPVSPIAERPTKTSSTTMGEAGERASTKAAGKRLAVRTAPDVQDSAQFSSKPGNAGKYEGVLQGSAASIGQSTLKAVPNGKKLVQAVDETQTVSSDSSYRREDGVRQQRSRPNITTPQLDRSKPETIAPQHRSSETRGGRRVPTHSLLSSSTATTSNVAVQGTIIEVDDNVQAREAANALQELQGSPDSDLRRSGSAVTLTPTAPSPTPNVPLARSKSQLTLLLERQKETRGRR